MGPLDRANLNQCTIGTMDIVQNLSFNYISPSFVTYRNVITLCSHHSKRDILTHTSVTMSELPCIQNFRINGLAKTDTGMSA
jgi:hypothetical protein